MLVVVDTNVLVSGLLNETGCPGKILDLILEGKLTLAYDDRILGEYEDVLARPELSLDKSQTEAVIAYLELSGQFIEPQPISSEGFPDKEDLAFAEVFLSAGAEALISGNLRHFTALVDKGLPVYSPRQFLDSL